MPRELDATIGTAVAARTVLRTPESVREQWSDVGVRVATGNLLLSPTVRNEFENLALAIQKGTVLLSGRHLQHGDMTQPFRNIEVFSNCSTAATTFVLFYLLLNGSGVGRSYDDDLMLVNWKYMPRVIPVLDATHPDWDRATYTAEDKTYHFLTPEEAYHTFPKSLWESVEDSREGWARVVESIETKTFQEIWANQTIIVDFSQVRGEGQPIKGMQNRPSSGPIPLMQAIIEMQRIASLKLPKWESTLRIDHALADVVVSGGARRSARMAIKNYKDADILDFIKIKEKGGLWSANNSVGVDALFWKNAAIEGSREQKIFQMICEAQYYHGSGEPGVINLDKLKGNRPQDGDERAELADRSRDTFEGTSKFPIVNPVTQQLYKALGASLQSKMYPMIVNPCGEIVLNSVGGYCVIADVVPFHADDLTEARFAFILATRALIRTNTMPAFYQEEVDVTNRIGVGMTGIHEFAWKFFKLGFRDLLDESVSHAFWTWIAETRDLVEEFAGKACEEYLRRTPATFTTIKPAGTTSKLFGLTEGAHLPAMREYIRWVQFREDDPLIEEYRSKGYPVMDTIPVGNGGQGYKYMKLVGFPTRPTIASLGIPEDKFVTATDATPEEQYQWVQLLEKYWLGANGNQVSYTLKYNAKSLSFWEYQQMLLKYQSQVRCTSVLAADDWKETQLKYGYVPEEPITPAQYDQMIAHIAHMEEVISLEALQCANGVCPL